MEPFDRRLVAALQINARATYRQLAYALDISESTVARRLSALMDAGVVRFAAHADPMICDLGRPMLVRIRCRPGAAGGVAAVLAPRPDVRFLAGVTGTYDLIMELIVRSKRHLAQVLSYELMDVTGITHTTTDAVLRQLKTSFDWSRALLTPEEIERLESPVQATVRAGQIVLDEDDFALIAALAVDGRATYKELAVRTGMSESTARRRVEHLLRSGAVLVAVLVEPAELGFEAEFFFHARVQPDRLERVADAFAARPEVRYLSSSYGYGGLTGEVILPTQDDVYDFSRDTFGTLDGIRDVEIALEIETYKRAHHLSAIATSHTENT